ncbi:MAG: hypothetical protein LBM16_02570, partial [Clostridiales bacterium]|nr:hypothetical protein [Clostridiales bacterium]
MLIASRTNALDKLFTYHVPEKLCLTEGFRVKIPFGAGNKITEGYVISIKENSGISIAPEKIKEIFSVIDSYPIFTKETLSLAKWMSKKYYCRLSDCLRTIAPCGAVFPKSGIRQKKLEKTAKIARINPDVNISIEMLSEKQQRVFEFVSSNISVYVKDIKEMLQISDSVIKTLAKKEIILIQEEEVLRSVLDGNEKTSPPELTGLQKKAIFEISQNSEKKPVLICGV